MRRSRKRAICCLPILLFHLVIDADGWVTVPSASSSLLLRRLSTSLHSLPNDADDYRRHRIEDEELGGIFAKHRKCDSQQSRPENYAEPSVTGPLSPSAHNKQHLSARRINERRWKTALFAKRYADDSDEASLNGKNRTTTTNRKGFAGKEKVNRSRLIDERNDRTVELTSNTSSSTPSDRKNGDRTPISSVAMALAGFFGDLNATHVTATDNNSSADVQNVAFPQPSGDACNVSSVLVVESDNSTASVILESVLAVPSNSSLQLNTAANLVGGFDTSTLLADSNSTISHLQNSSILLKKEASSVPVNLTSTNESVALSDALASSDTLPTRVDSEPAKPIVKKRPKLKVTWLDAPVKSEYKKKVLVVPDVLQSNLTSNLKQINPSTSTSRSSDDVYLQGNADKIAEHKIISQAADINQTSALSSSSLKMEASAVNVSISNKEKTIEGLSEVTHLRTAKLDDDGSNHTSDTDTKLSTLTDSNPIESVDTDTVVDTNAASPVSFGSVSPTLPLLPDDNYAPSSITFEPGPPPAPLLPNDSALSVTSKFEAGSPPAPLVPDVNAGTVNPVFEARAPPAPLLPKDCVVPGSPKFEPRSPPAPLLPKDTFSPPSSYKTDAPSESQEFDPTQPPENFGSFVQEIAKDTMPDVGGSLVKSVDDEHALPSSVLLANENAAQAIPKFEPGSVPAPLLPDVNIDSVSPVFEARMPPAPLLPNDSVLPGSPKFEPGSPPAPLLPTDTFSPPSSYKSDAPSDSQEFDPTKPPKNFGSFVQEVAKDMMPDFGRGSVKPAEEFGSFVREVAKGSMPVDDTKGSDTPKPAREFGSYVEGIANERLPKETVQGGTASNPAVIVDDEENSNKVGEEWDPRKPPSNFGSYVNELAKSKMSGSGDGGDFESDIGILDTTPPDNQSWENNYSGPGLYSENSNQDSSAEMDYVLNQRSTNAFDRAETWDPWKFDVMSQTLGKSSRFPSSTLDDFAGSGLETSLGGRSTSPSRDTQSSFERAETWDPWKFDVTSQTLGKSTIFPSSYPADIPPEESSSDFSDNEQGASSGFGSQAPVGTSFDRAKNWDPWKFDVMSQTLGKSNLFPSSSPEDFVNTGISSPQTIRGSGSSKDSSTRSSFERAETWDPWKFDVLSQTLGKTTHFPSSAPQDFSAGGDQLEEYPAPRPGQRMISYEKTETWDPRTFNVLSQTLGKTTSFPAPGSPSAPSSEPSWPSDPPQSSSDNSSNSFTRAEKWDPWAFDVLKQTLGKSTIFPSSTPQDFSGGGGDGGFGNDWFASSQDSRPSSPLGPSSSTYSPQGVFNRPRTVSGTFDPSDSLSGAGRSQSAGQGSSASWNGSSSVSSGSIAGYAQPNGVFDPTSQSGVTSYLQDATRAHFGNAPNANDESFPVQNSQLSGDYSESRFKILTGEAAPLHWDPVKETWVEQGTGKPVAATSKSEITPPKKQEQVSVRPAVVSQQQPHKERQPARQPSTPQRRTEDVQKSANDPSNDANLDRKKFFAGLFEQDSQSSNKENPAATVDNGDTSREAIFGRAAQASPEKVTNQSSRSKATSTKATKRTENLATKPTSNNSSRNIAEKERRSSGNQGGDETYRSNMNRQEIFTELRSNYQPGSLRLDIPENLFGVPQSRKPEYVDNTANRGFGPFQGGWGRSPQFQENPAENVYIDLPREEEDRRDPSSSSMYSESPPFERNDFPASMYGDSPPFESNDFPPLERNDVLVSGLYGDAPPFQTNTPPFEVYQEENRSKEYREDLPGAYSDTLFPQPRDDDADFRERSSASYLDSMRRSGDNEPNGSEGVFDWGSYVSEQTNQAASSSPPDFPEEDPGGYYIADPTLYDSGFDDYPPVISFAEASRPQMRSYLDSLYKSSQTNGYWDSSSSGQDDPFSKSQEQSYFLEPPEESSSLFESQPQSSSFDVQDKPSSLSTEEKPSAPTTAYFRSTAWNPKEDVDPNQNPFARYSVYAESDSSASPQSAGAPSLDNGYNSANANGNENNNDGEYTKIQSEENPPTPKRGSQVYPEVKNSWFGGGSYLDSMNQRRWDDGQNS